MSCISCNGQTVCKDSSNSFCDHEYQAQDTCYDELLPCKSVNGITITIRWMTMSPGIAQSMCHPYGLNSTIVSIATSVSIASMSTVLEGGMFSWFWNDGFDPRIPRCQTAIRRIGVRFLKHSTIVHEVWLQGGTALSRTTRGGREWACVMSHYVCTHRAVLSFGVVITTNNSCHPDFSPVCFTRCGLSPDDDEESSMTESCTQSPSEEETWEKLRFSVASCQTEPVRQNAVRESISPEKTFSTTCRLKSTYLIC